MKKIKLLLLLAIVFLISSAFQIQYGRNVVISRPVYEDLYIAGGTVTINAPVHGDLIVAGGTIIINDSITNDIILAGGTITFNGYVGDDVRCAGGELHVIKNIGGDLIIAGGRVETENDAMIGGLMLGGGNVVINGPVRNNIIGRFDELTLNGSVGGDIDCRGNKLTLNGRINGKSVLAGRKITIGDTAFFSGQLRYWSKAPVDFKKSVANGRALFDPALEIHFSKWYLLGSTTIVGLLLYLGMALVMIAVIQFLFPGIMKKGAANFYGSPLKSLGFGVLYFVGTPIAAAIILITLIGIPVALLLLAGYIILFILGTVITSVILSNWINNVYNKNWNFWNLVFAAFGLFILLKMISLTPFVGWVVLLLGVCTAFGGILLGINWKKKRISPTNVAI